MTIHVNLNFWEAMSQQIVRIVISVLGGQNINDFKVIQTTKHLLKKIFDNN